MLLKAAACMFALVLSLGGCATVDLSGGEETAGPVMTPAEQTLRAEGEALERLAEDRGWVAEEGETSRASRIANVLLNGVTGDDEPELTPHAEYLEAARQAPEPVQLYIKADLARAEAAMTKVNAAAQAIVASPARSKGMTANLQLVESLGQTSLSIVDFFETVALQASETEPGLETALLTEIQRLDVEANRMIGFADALAERRRAAMDPVTS